jgi:hypothetical protein
MVCPEGNANPVSFASAYAKISEYPVVPQAALSPARRDLYALNCRTHPPEYGAFFQPDDKRTRLLNMIFHPGFHALTNKDRPPRMQKASAPRADENADTTETSAEQYMGDNPPRLRDRFRYPVQRFKPRGICPGCHIQPEIHTARGIISKMAAPAAVRLAIESMSSPFR